MSENALDFLAFAFGKQSPFNLAGKIIMSPFIVILGLTFTVLDVCFLRKEK